MLATLLVAAIGFVGLNVLVVGLIFLGGQIATILGGRVLFGTGGEGCQVTGIADSFSPTQSIHYAAHLERDVVAGEAITLVVTLPDGTTRTADTKSGSAGACLYDDIAAGLEQGAYTIKFMAGDELLSQGDFEITP